MESDAGGLHRLPADYLAAHAEHAYALTGHGTQGGTVEWAGVVGTPEDFTRNWAYTALAHGREPTRLYVASELPAPARERAAERQALPPSVRVLDRPRAGSPRVRGPVQLRRALDALHGACGEISEHGYHWRSATILSLTRAHDALGFVAKMAPWG